MNQARQDKYDLKGDMELARETFEAQLEANRREIYRNILMSVQSFGQGLQGSFGSQYNATAYNGAYGADGTTVSIQFFGALVAMAARAQLQQQGPRASGPIRRPVNAAKKGSFTPAPIGPSKRKKQSGYAGSLSPIDTALPKAAPVPPKKPQFAGRLPSSKPAGATESSAMKSGRKQIASTGPDFDSKAPIASDRCAAYKIHGEDGKFARLRNTCKFPISWLWCWVPQGETKCTPNQISETVAANSSVMIPGPGPEETTRVVARVCDMSDPDKFCTP